MQLIHIRNRAALALAISLALAPSVAYASTETVTSAPELTEAQAISELVEQNEISGDLIELAHAYSAGDSTASKANKADRAGKASKAKASDGKTGTRANAASKTTANKAANASSKQKKADKADKADVSRKASKASDSKTSTRSDTSDKWAKNSKASKSAKSSSADKASKANSSAKKSAARKVLDFDRALIKKIGTQEETGHTICCPSFSCAYADAVMDGTVHDHEYYTCSCCTWTDWGGGGSSDRCVGTDEELLREAYDQISAGKPTVIHVAGVSGEHWIALIGYKNVQDPDHLTLANFAALDPWDGAKITASDRYSLYGDGCEHISDRKIKRAQ